MSLCFLINLVKPKNIKNEKTTLTYSGLLGISYYYRKGTKSAGDD